MKKIILPLFFLLLIFPSSAFSQQNTIKLTTIIPPPINTFSRLILSPQDSTSYCTGKQNGTVFIDIGTYEPVVCMSGAPHRSNNIPWYLTQLNDIHLKDVESSAGNNFTVNMGPVLSPEFRLKLNKPTSQAGIINSIYINPDDGGVTHNFNMNLTTRGNPNAGQNHASYLDFYVGPPSGPPGSVYSGSLIYMDKRNNVLTPFGLSGFGIKANNNSSVMDIWLDINSSIAINSDMSRSPNPLYKLEIFGCNPPLPTCGNLKVSGVTLIDDGTHKADLQAQFASGGYYAILAP